MRQLLFTTEAVRSHKHTHTQSNLGNPWNKVFTESDSAHFNYLLKYHTYELELTYKD